MNAYTQLLNYLVSLLNADIDINTILEGNQIDRIDISKKNIYPLAWMDLSNGTFTDNNLQFNVRLEVLDQLDINKEIKTDKLFTNDNRVDVYNTSLQSLRRVFNELKQNNNIQLLDSTGTFNKVTDDKNNLIGWGLDITIQVPNDLMSICQ